eukprot:s1503_g21.t3
MKIVRDMPQPIHFKIDIQLQMMLCTLLVACDTKRHEIPVHATLAYPRQSSPAPWEKFARQKRQGQAAASKGVKRRIGKASKSGNTQGSSKASKTVLEVATGPQARRALVASSARAGKVPAAPKQLGPRPKMNGARMMQEIEEAREHAEKVTAVTAKGKPRRRPKSRLSQHSQQVLAAFNVRSETPFFPKLR